MGAPRYVAKRQGDEYVITRVDPTGLAIRAASLLAGASMAAYGARRHGWLAAGTVFGGAAIAYWAWTGKSLVKACTMSGAAAPRGDAKAAVGGGADGSVGTGSTQVPADALDEALMGSFPASDPPGSGGSGRT